jgi:hypothetical protein
MSGQAHQFREGQLSYHARFYVLELAQELISAEEARALTYFSLSDTFPKSGGQSTR